MFFKGHATCFETPLDETTAEVTAAGVREETETVLDTSVPEIGASHSFEFQLFSDYSLEFY